MEVELSVVLELCDLLFNGYLLSVQVSDKSFQLSFFILQLLLGSPVEVHEFVEGDFAIVINVSVLEKLVNNFISVLLVDLLGGQVALHLLTVDAAIVVAVHLHEVFLKAR